MDGQLKVSGGTFKKLAVFLQRPREVALFYIDFNGLINSAVHPVTGHFG